MTVIYWRALQLKWYMFGGLSSFSMSCFWVFELFPKQALAAQWGLVALLTVTGGAMFYEWYMAPENTRMGRCCVKIFKYSFQRTKHLTDMQALFDVRILLVTIHLIAILGFLCWIYPEYIFWLGWVITVLSGIMGTYMFNEEFKAPCGYRNRWAFLFSIIVFALIVMLIQVLSHLGFKYGQELHEAPIFIVTLGSWFSTGILGAFFRASVQMWRDHRTAVTT